MTLIVQSSVLPLATIKEDGLDVNDLFQLARVKRLRKGPFFVAILGADEVMPDRETDKFGKGSDLEFAVDRAAVGFYGSDTDEKRPCNFLITLAVRKHLYDVGLARRKWHIGKRPRVIVE